MINDVMLEGIVVRTWKFADDLLFRLDCYRDSDLPQKPLHSSSSAQRAYETQDAADFVTIRVVKGNLVEPVMVAKGTHLREHGYWQSRDYQESLPQGHCDGVADFLKDARGAELPVPETLDPFALRAPRGATEIVARRIMNQPIGVKSG